MIRCCVLDVLDVVHFRVVPRGSSRTVGDICLIYLYFCFLLYLYLHLYLYLCLYLYLYPDDEKGG